MEVLDDRYEQRGIERLALPARVPLERDLQGRGEQHLSKGAVAESPLVDLQTPAGHHVVDDNNEALIGVARRHRRGHVPGKPNCSFVSAVNGTRGFPRPLTTNSRSSSTGMCTAREKRAQRARATLVLPAPGTPLISHTLPDFMPRDAA